jgi:ferredoxin--NADP+ reductase
MTDRVNEIVQKLSAQTEASIGEVLDRIKPIEDFTAAEKIDLSAALTSIFYHFRHADSSHMLKLAIRTEKRIAKFGVDVVPFLFNEIIDVDGESAAYLGKAMVKIGKPGIDYILQQWDAYLDNEPALINLIQTLSYYTLSEVEGAIPLILNTTKRESFQLTSMALYTIGRLVEKSKPSKIDPSLLSTLFETAFSFLSHAKPLVRKNAARTLGKMLRKGLLPAQDEKRVHNAFLSIMGKDEHHNWDRAFIVRREAEDFLKYFDVTPPVVCEYIQSFRILSKRLLCAKTFHFVIEAPFIARKIEAGQFIIIRPHATSERIPLSVCGWDRRKGTVEIIISAVGKTSTEINQMRIGDTFKDVVGPLGERSRIPVSAGTCVVIGGGYGTGAIIPTARDMKAKGNKVIGIVGARNLESLIMTDELKAVCDAVMITTNDGSQGLAGFVTDALKGILTAEKVIHVLAVGPVPMMKAVSEMTRPHKIETFVSLNAIMVDGTGMCGACRVSVGNETKFACFHGPDFDGHLVDFDNLMKRQKMFIKEEKIAFEGMDALKTADHER